MPTRQVVILRRESLEIQRVSKISKPIRLALCVRGNIHPIILYQ